MLKANDFRNVAMWSRRVDTTPFCPEPKIDYPLATLAGRFNAGDRVVSLAGGKIS
jgi:hypothetical protein